MALWVPPNIQSHFISIGTVIGLLLSTLAYIRIYLAVRRHKNQIGVQQVQNAANFASLIKSVVGTFYVFLVFLACYLPIFICLTAIAIYGPNVALNRLFLFSCTLVFLNSSQPDNLLLEDETDSTHCHEHIAEHVLVPN